MTTRPTKTVLAIVGMRNNECRERIAEALARVSGVRTADVNLFRASATVIHDPTCNSDDLARVVMELGYGIAAQDSRARPAENKRGGG